jgi:hypothetical protein
MKVLAISGWKGSGKDTVAQYLVDNHGFARTSFADPLKDMAAKEYGFVREWADDPKYKESPLLNYPVEPKDKFTNLIADFMLLEFRDKNGKKPEFGSSEKLYWTPRALCILKGSTNRAVDSAYWVKQAVSSIKEKYVKRQEFHVITDLRYKSELYQLKDAFQEDVIFVRINRFESSPSSDPSERDLDDHEFDFYIDNTNTKELALNQVDIVLNFLK